LVGECSVTAKRERERERMAKKREKKAEGGGRSSKPLLSN
jgi:hypothetical protein